MTQKDLNNWFMYYEIQKLSLLGFSNSRIAHYLGIDRRTVSKYLSMNEEGFEAHLIKGEHRNRVLSPYEDFVKGKLTDYPDTSAAQMHDWLKEHFPNLPEVSARTVYNFVVFIRQKHNIPVQKLIRDYFPVAELPYGQQAQVDFGEYNMRMSDGGRKKVWFFAMVLSRSRMKYVWFQQKPFTAETVCQTHERAFAFFGGIPRVLVYDQDRTMLVDENLGKLILTSGFRQYVKSRGFQLHFCRKSDPESKGKIENVVKYVKINFLTNRTYHDLDTLNTEALAWLSRTANHLIHNATRKSPEVEHSIEKAHLQPYIPLPVKNKDQQAGAPTYLVRKNNVIHYKGNFYSVPQGTYKHSETYVTVKQNGGIIEIYAADNNIICSHKMSTEKGKTIINTNHRRDTSRSLNQLKEQVLAYFDQCPEATQYLEEIHRLFPRYFRDHLREMLKTLKNYDEEIIERTLTFCIKNRLYDAGEFAQVAGVACLEQAKKKAPKKTHPEIKPLHSRGLDKAGETPETSNLDDYEQIINS